MSDPAPLRVEHCDVWATIEPPGPFVMGREGDLVIDDNPYLHRSLLSLQWDRLWWLTNVGSSLSATVSGGDGAVHAWLAPGGALPLVFARTEVRVTAGPTTYAVGLHLDEPALIPVAAGARAGATTTAAPASLTHNQKLLVLALAEPSLRTTPGVPGALPSSKEAAQRLGWTTTKLNRQLDAVCQKLARSGVRGLHGATGELATRRRARLVEYALAVRLVTADDLLLLDRAATGDAGPEPRPPDH